MFLLGRNRVEGSEAKLLKRKRLVSWSVCLDATDWKVRIRWFELVVSLAPVPVAGPSQRICKDRLVTPPEIVFILIHTLVIRTHCSGCVRWAQNSRFEQLKLEKNEFKKKVSLQLVRHTCSRARRRRHTRHLYTCGGWPAERLL